jgi:hypothetical protein
MSNTNIQTYKQPHTQTNRQGKHYMLSLNNHGEGIKRHTLDTMSITNTNKEIWTIEHLVRLFGIN